MLPLLKFDEGFFERIWGGQRLRSLYGKEIPSDRPIGESWVVSDHSEKVSAVVSGPLTGLSLRDLVADHEEALLGRLAHLTVHGTFPLLLKLLDANDVLSVQVHPDDATAECLGEPDVGKTEMWHVLKAEPGSRLICGLDPAVQPGDLRQAVEDGSLKDKMISFEVTEGDSVFVPAGTVHAIGKGIVLAEIQQNSNLTYRLYDWDRVQEDGQPRELHIDKAMEAVHFGSEHGGKQKPLTYESDGTTVTVLAACRLFAAERIRISGTFNRCARGDSFHIVLAVTGRMACETADSRVELAPGEAVIVPACHESFAVHGHGDILDYYVPDLQLDVIQPLRRAVGDDDGIIRLGGAPEESDIIL